MFQPILCRPEAYQLFMDQLPILETTEGLLNAAIAVSLHALDDVDPDEVRQQLDDLAEKVRFRIHSDDPIAKLTHLHEVLFVEEGFRGENFDYYSALNSYLPAVLATRRGIPITLSLVYKAVAERLGLDVEGINTPGHFLVRVHAGRDTMIIDPFYSGHVFSRSEVLTNIDRVFGYTGENLEHYLAGTTHRTWLARLLRNLQHNFSANGYVTEVAAMAELQTLLEQMPR